MKRTVVSTFLYVVVVLSLVTSVFAASPNQQSGPTNQSSSASQTNSLGKGPQRTENETPTALAGVQPAVVTVGQPGTSFRYEKTFGVTGVPYLADNGHLNGPWGITTDSVNNVYVVEGNGDRLLRYNSSGVNTLIIGHAGVNFSHDDYLNAPVDLAVTNSGHMWVTSYPVVKEFDSSGNLVQSIPAVNPWDSGTDNGRFDNPTGIVISPSGLLFIADANNERIQVYDISSVPAVYVNTIGVTGVSGNDNTHFGYLNSLAFDSQNALYVLDSGNYRVQKCTSANNWVNWSCSTFFGGSIGSNPANGEMDWSMGLHVDSSDNVFIAEGVNSRILKCTSAGVCTHFIGTAGVRGTGNNDVFGWAVDVTTDSSGNVYVSDSDNFTIRKYSSTGAFVSTFGGTTLVPYLTDTSHLNAPWGVIADEQGNLYVTENRGHRVVKYNAQGVQQWAVGHAGIFWQDWPSPAYPGNTLLGSSWAGLEGNPALDANGNLYVADTGNDRVQVFKASDGAYVATMGMTREGGTNNSQFACPTGVAVSPVSGDIFVVDRCNQRVQVFTSTRIYKATIGVTGVSGTDNQHFNGLWGVAIDKNGVIYVADSDNNRIQKCTLVGTSSNCSTFLGETGVFDNRFNHFHPLAVAVDNDGRVYVADEWNTRVQVYDASGAYLTTIGGAWGQQPGQLVNPSGVSVDNKGNVYVVDRNNHRIQKFALGVPGWKQANINGFGNINNPNAYYIATHNEMMYFGAGVNSPDPRDGAEVWRSADGKNWNRVASAGLGDVANTRFLHGVSFNGYLYTGTQNNVNGAEIWRCAVCDGTDWSRVVAGGSGDVNYTITEIVTLHAGKLYASISGADGVSILRSSTGAPGSWSQVNVGGFGNIKNTESYTLIDFNSYLYVPTTQWRAWSEGTGMTGTEVWRCSACDGTDWAKVNTNGFGSTENLSNSAAVFNNALYIGTLNLDLGAQIWRCTACDGTDWVKVNANGFGITKNAGVTLVPFNGKLYAPTVENWMSAEKQGATIYSTTNGTDWTPNFIDGWGDVSNGGTSPGVVFKGNLYLAAGNDANGAEIWQMMSMVYLPLTMR